MRIKKDDTVKIMTGRDSGKTGKVLKYLQKTDKVVLEGLNLYKKHVRPKKQGEKGETVEVPRPIAISNIMLVCSSCKKPTRIGYRIEGQSKVRICKRCKATT